MAIKNGVYTTEFWVTMTTNIVGAAIALAVGYGLITREEGDLWLALLMSISLMVIPLVLAYVNGKYIKSRQEVKTTNEMARVYEARLVNTYPESEVDVIGSSQ